MLTRSLVCTENPEEAQTSTVEEALKLECNISVNTNFLLSGILDASYMRKSWKRLTDRILTNRWRR